MKNSNIKDLEEVKGFLQLQPDMIISRLKEILREKRQEHMSSDADEKFVPTEHRLHEMLREYYMFLGRLDEGVLSKGEILQLTEAMEHANQCLIIEMGEGICRTCGTAVDEETFECPVCREKLVTTAFSELGREELIECLHIALHSSVSLSLAASAHICITVTDGLVNKKMRNVS